MTRVYSNENECRKKCTNICEFRNSDRNFICKTTPTTSTSATSTCPNGQYQIGTQFKNKASCEKYYLECSDGVPSHCINSCEVVKNDGMCLDHNDMYVSIGSSTIFKIYKKYVGGRVQNNM